MYFIDRSLHIYSSLNELFIEKGDRELLRIGGHDIRLLELVIDGFRENSNPKDVYELMKANFFNDESHFSLIIDFLIQNQILKPQIEINSLNKKLLFVGRFPDCLQVSNRLAGRMGEYSISVEDVKNFTAIYQRCNSESAPDMIILFSPLFLYTDELLELSDFCYSKNVDIFNIGIEDAFITIGPIIAPKVNSPSLKCYIKRKYASLDRPSDVLAVRKLKDRKALRELDLAENHLFNLGIEFLILELEKYFKYDKTFLVGREVELNCLDFAVERTRILHTIAYDGYQTHVNPVNG